MEIMGNFAELIATLGFPIALVVVLCWFIWKIYKKSEQREDALRSQIVESQKVNAEAIHTITLYAERLTVIENDIKDVKTNVNSLLMK
jgi:flagellar biogenesis protein FliO